MLEYDISLLSLLPCISGMSLTYRDSPSVVSSDYHAHQWVGMMHACLGYAPPLPLQRRPGLHYQVEVKVRTASKGRLHTALVWLEPRSRRTKFVARLSRRTS